MGWRQTCAPASRASWPVASVEQSSTTTIFLDTARAERSVSEMTLASLYAGITNHTERIPCVLRASGAESKSNREGSLANFINDAYAHFNSRLCLNSPLPNDAETSSAGTAFPTDRETFNLFKMREF